MANIINTAELKKLRDALAVTSKAAESAATDYLLGAHALEEPSAKQRLTEGYRAERRDELRDAAKKALRARNVNGLLQQAAAVAPLRGQLDDPGRTIREARFVELVPPLDGDESDWLDTNKHRQQLNEHRLLRDELMRLRLKDELRDGDDGDLRAAIQEATATGTPALLHLVGNEVRRREKDKPDSVSVQVKSALLTAKQAVPPPADVVEQSALLDEIDRLARRTADAEQTILTGKLQDRGAAVARVAELSASGLSPTETAQAFVEERTAAKQARDRQAAVRATKEVRQAILADEQGTPRIKIPIGEKQQSTNSTAE
jgi:hypothetical protein